MKQIQKIAQNVLVLLMDILVFTWQVVRKVILPTRSRKGNLLSSLLAFFVGLLERIVSFEKSILERPVVFTHKYVKQGLIIAVCFLFLLSSFEWTIGPSANTSGNGSQVLVTRAPVADSFRKVEMQQMDVAVSLPTGQMTDTRQTPEEIAERSVAGGQAVLVDSLCGGPVFRDQVSNSH